MHILRPNITITVNPNPTDSEASHPPLSTASNCCPQLLFIARCVSDMNSNACWLPAHELILPCQSSPVWRQHPSDHWSFLCALTNVLVDNSVTLIERTDLLWLKDMPSVCWTCEQSTGQFVELIHVVFAWTLAPALDRYCRRWFQGMVRTWDGIGILHLYQHNQQTC